ncbi:MAG: TIGR04282 family arsenosugar biosynthesis glycosyltransferase [Pyrinomonadaceae bacterium]
MKRSIIVMTKVPYFAEVKTRMQPFLTRSEAAGLAEAFLCDTENKISKFECETIIAFTPAEGEEKLKEILSSRHLFVKQDGRDLGERMDGAFRFGFRNGSECAVMIGTDSPSFPADLIEQAFESLADGADVVMGKTEDGGFYLIGFSITVREIFAGVEWSTENTFQQTLANIRKQKLVLKTLPVWYDVDRPEDLERLNSELKKDPAAAANSQKWFRKSPKFEKG